jgi:predicted RNA binding protein YcfA (HicA-like mRNA interferase family)
LKAKGFREKRGGDHYRLVYYDGELKTAIRTKVSHHSKVDYREGLLKQVQKQVGLPELSDLLDLIDCPMDEATYRAILVEQGLL